MLYKFFVWLFNVFLYKEEPKPEISPEEALRESALKDRMESIRNSQKAMYHLHMAEYYKESSKLATEAADNWDNNDYWNRPKD